MLAALRRRGPAGTADDQLRIHYHMTGRFDSIVDQITEQFDCLATKLRHGLSYRCELNI